MDIELAPTDNRFSLETSSHGNLLNTHQARGYRTPSLTRCLLRVGRWRNQARNV